MCESSFVRQQLRTRYNVMRVYKNSMSSQYSFQFEIGDDDYTLLRIRDCDYWLVEKINHKTNEFLRQQVKTFQDVIKVLDQLLNYTEKRVSELFMSFFCKNKKMLVEKANGKTYQEFIQELSNTGFSLMEFLNENEKIMLYHLATKGE